MNNNNIPPATKRKAVQIICPQLCPLCPRVCPTCMRQNQQAKAMVVSSMRDCFEKIESPKTKEKKELTCNAKCAVQKTQLVKEETTSKKDSTQKTGIPNGRRTSKINDEYPTQKIQIVEERASSKEKRSRPPSRKAKSPTRVPPPIEPDANKQNMLMSKIKELIRCNCNDKKKEHKLTLKHESDDDTLFESCSESCAHFGSDSTVFYDFDSDNENCAKKKVSFKNFSEHRKEFDSSVKRKRGSMTIKTEYDKDSPNGTAETSSIDIKLRAFEVHRCKCEPQDTSAQTSFTEGFIADLKKELCTKKVVGGSRIAKLKKPRHKDKSVNKDKIQNKSKIPVRTKRVVSKSRVESKKRYESSIGGDSTKDSRKRTKRVEAQVALVSRPVSSKTVDPLHQIATKNRNQNDYIGPKEAVTKKIDSAEIKEPAQLKVPVDITGESVKEPTSIDQEEQEPKSPENSQPVERQPLEPLEMFNETPIPIIPSETQITETRPSRVAFVTPDDEHTEIQVTGPPSPTNPSVRTLSNTFATASIINELNKIRERASMEEQRSSMISIYWDHDHKSQSADDEAPETTDSYTPSESIESEVDSNPVTNKINNSTCVRIRLKDESSSELKSILASKKSKRKKRKMSMSNDLTLVDMSKTQNEIPDETTHLISLTAGKNNKQKVWKVFPSKRKEKYEDLDTTSIKQHKVCKRPNTCYCRQQSGPTCLTIHKDCQMTPPTGSSFQTAVGPQDLAAITDVASRKELERFENQFHEVFDDFVISCDVFPHTKQLDEVGVERIYTDDEKIKIRIKMKDEGDSFNSFAGSTHHTTHLEDGKMMIFIPLPFKK